MEGRTRRREGTILENPGDKREEQGSPWDWQGRGSRSCVITAALRRSPRGGPGTHLPREQVEDLGGEGDQALGVGVFF